MRRSVGTYCVGAGVLTLAGASLVVSAQTTTTTTPSTAETLVKKCANIRTGELVWIHGGTQEQKLLEDIAIEVRKLGGHPLLSFGSDRLTRSMWTEIPERFDTQEPAFALKLAETVNAVLSVDYEQHPDLLTDIPAKRQMERAKATDAVRQTLLERGVLQVNLGNGLYPTLARARQFGLSETQLSDIFWNAVNVDYDRLQATAAQVKNTLATGREIQIKAPNGTDLTFQITGRPVFASDGVISSDERYAGGPECQVWLPAGEVYVTPVPGTARGTFVADNFFFEGKRIENLKLEFSNGRLTKMTASSDITPLKAQFDAAPSGRDVFAALDLGINPNIQTPPGSKLVTWMGAGTISIGIGDNTWAGGENNVPYGLYAHLTTGTLTVDNKTLVERGRLNVPR